VSDLRKVVLVGLLLCVGWVSRDIYATFQTDDTSHCPTEDSCTAGYHNPDEQGPEGVWIITEDVP
jgi:hypothetical protein